MHEIDARDAAVKAKQRPGDISEIGETAAGTTEDET
jgi:hypothetical protein